MKEIIKQLCNTDELVEIYTNPADSDKFGVAYIVACSDEHFLAHSFQENDLDDGYYMDRIDSVNRIQRNTVYLNNMLQFIKPKAGRYELPKGYCPDFDLFGAVLNLCLEKHLVAQVAVNRDFTRFGWVKSFNDDVLEMDYLDCEGMPDGTTYLRMSDITMVGFGGVDEERRAKLFRNRTHQKTAKQ